ncbi:MAG: FliH/SctL family protein [Caldimonas sp.]
MTDTRPGPAPPVAEGARLGLRDFSSRFIPREELSSFAIWAFADVARPESAADAGAPEAAPEGVAAGELSAEQLRAVRQSGYQDGYRDGLVALESFKRSFASQMTTQVGTLVAATLAQLDALQHEMARSVAMTAAALARQILRSELSAHPDRIRAVAEQAVDALMPSAGQIVVRVHPDDLGLVTGSSAEAIAGRGARLVADARISRGGCLVESDIGLVDATIEERWRSAAARLGSDAAWGEAVCSPDLLAADAGSPFRSEANDAAAS